MESIEKLTQDKYRYSARYTDCLDRIIHKLNGVKILRLEYDNGYQGFVDVDVLLTDKRVFSYKYTYGSCSGCDEWESRDLSSSEIENEMLKEATLFSDEYSYKKWRELVESEGVV